MPLAAKRFDNPDEVRSFPRGRMDVVLVDGHAVGLATFQPGWRWSEHVRPAVATASCRAAHVGYLLRGRLAVRMDDGTEAVAKPGDVVAVPPGHDGWVVGDEPCVMLDWGAAAEYARR